MQLDLFGASMAPAKAPVVAPAPPPVRALPFPTPPTVAWAQKLAEGDPRLQTWFLVSSLWTRVVAENLSLGAAGRWLLYADGQIRQIAADPGCMARIVYTDAATLCANC